jgi:hypothetical protein
MDEDPVIDALRRRPSDERAYKDPLRPWGRAREDAEPFTPLVPSLGIRTHGGRRPAIRPRLALGPVATLVVIAIIVALVVATGTWARLTVPEPEPTQSARPIPTFTPTGMVGCDGVGPGWPRGQIPPSYCQVLGVPPDAMSAGVWTLDPTYPYSPYKEQIHVLIRSVGICPLTVLDGYVAQSVEYGRYVAISLAIVPAPGHYSSACGDAPEASGWVPYELALSEPVGPRDLLDGGTDPMTMIAPAHAP